MNEQSIDLEPEKRARILHAALDEFAKKGYKNASTNEIVKSAGVSKGLLFHYFGNKKALFLLLLDRANKIFADEFYSRINFEEADIIKRWRQVALLKIDLIQKYPELYGFLITSNSEDDSEIAHEVESRSRRLTEAAYGRLLMNIDTSVYKKDMDANRISEIILWTAQGFGNSVLEKLKTDPGYRSGFDLNSVMAEFDEYMELLSSAFYKRKSGECLL